MKEKILELRNQGMSYREIQKVLGCSRSLVSYYVNPDGKQKHRDRQNQNRYRKRTEYKTMLGGKCSHCGYNKCQDALQKSLQCPIPFGVKAVSRKKRYLRKSKSVIYYALTVIVNPIRITIFNSVNLALPRHSYVEALLFVP